MTHPNHAAAVVTAAGLSSRMKDFKPMLPLGNETISKLLIRRLKEAGVSPIVVITGHRAEELVNHLASPGVLFIHNKDFRTTEMFDSLTLGLSSLYGQTDNRFSRVFLTPADIPCILPATLEKLLKADADVAIPLYRGKKGHPVCISRDIIPGILSHNGENGLKGALKSLSAITHFVETDDPGILADADTPGEYENLRRLFLRMSRQDTPDQPLGGHP